MAEPTTLWSDFILTDWGLALRQKAISLGLQVEFVHAEIGEGVPTEPAAIPIMTALVQPAQQVQVVRSLSMGTTHHVDVQIDNRDFPAPIVTRELGVFARIQTPEDGSPALDDPELPGFLVLGMYGYAYTTSGYESIPAGSDFHRIWSIGVDTQIARATAIAIIYDGSAIYVTFEDLDPIQQMAQQAYNDVQEFKEAAFPADISALQTHISTMDIHTTAAWKANVQAALDDLVTFSQRTDTLASTTDPSPDTAGAIGQRFLNTATGKEFVLVEIADGKYIWKVSGSSSAEDISVGGKSLVDALREAAMGGLGLSDWVLLQNFATAGSGSWVAPDLLGDGSDYQIGVCIIGGGGSGGTRGPTASSPPMGSGGGGSGYVTHIVMTVTPGVSYPYVVGAGGPAVEATTFNLNGIIGSTSSFNGKTARGGNGGSAGNTEQNGNGGDGGSGGGGGRATNKGLGGPGGQNGGPGGPGTTTVYTNTAYLHGPGRGGFGSGLAMDLFGWCALAGGGPSGYTGQNGTQPITGGTVTTTSGRGGAGNEEIASYYGSPGMPGAVRIYARRAVA
jgi:hypothetical protein